MMIHASKVPGQSSVNMGTSATIEEPANGALAASGDLKHLSDHVNKMSSHVNMLGQKVQEIERFYSSGLKKQHNPKKKDKARQITILKKQQDRVAPSETMQELMCQFSKIFNQTLQKKGARSTLEFIDAKDLGLHNCMELNEKLRDFSAIKKRMEAKDGTGYNHVREMYTDVRTVLKNSMKFNDEKSDAHSTAKTLLEKFTEKWYILLPKIMQEDEKVEDDQALQQANHAQMAKDVNSELIQVEEQLKKLKERVIQKCRRMSTLEKREIGKALTKLSADELSQALEIVAQSNPAFQATAQEVDLDIDAQSEYTLRKLKYFILDVRKARENPLCVGGDRTDDHGNISTEKLQNANLKRKRELADAGGKTAKKKMK